MDDIIMILLVTVISWKRGVVADCSAMSFLYFYVNNQLSWVTQLEGSTPANIFCFFLLHISPIIFELPQQRNDCNLKLKGLKGVHMFQKRRSGRADVLIWFLSTSHFLSTWVFYFQTDNSTRWLSFGFIGTKVCLSGWVCSVAKPVVMVKVSSMKMMVVMTMMMGRRRIRMVGVIVKNDWLTCPTILIVIAIMMIVSQVSWLTFGQIELGEPD